MAGKKLYANVYVGGELQKAGSTPSKEVADQITNEGVWVKPDDWSEPAGADEPSADSEAK